MLNMIAVNNYVGAGIVILGVLAALASVIEPLSHIAIIVVNYLRKLFGGPIKVEPLTQEDLTKHV
jgi:hypothetical protein